MSYDLYLDDDRPCPASCVPARNYNEFVAIITERGLPNRVAFDHDLGTGRHDGQDCARWLVSYCLKHELPLPRCSVHSGNPVGANEIKSVLRSYDKFYTDNINGKRTNE